MVFAISSPAVTAADFQLRTGLVADGAMHWAERDAAGGNVFRVPGLDIEWREADGLVSATLRNTSPAPVKLGRFVVEGGVGFGIGGRGRVFDPTRK